MRAAERSPRVAMVMGSCHLPPPSLCWDKTVPRQHISLGAGLGLVVPPGTPLGCVPHPLSHHPGLGVGWPCWSRGGQGRRCWGQPCAFPPFPFVFFLCFSLLLSCPPQTCAWTSSSPIGAGRRRVGFAGLWRGPGKIKCSDAPETDFSLQPANTDGFLQDSPSSGAPKRRHVLARYDQRDGPQPLHFLGVLEGV